MRILVFGGSGTLGSEIVSQLKAAGHEVQSPTSREFSIENARDLHDLQQSCFGNLDWVINCAAYTAVDKAEEEPMAAMKLNGVAAAGLAAICKLRDWRFLHFSTDYVFDGKKGAPYTEKDLPRPLNAYGRSKFIGERNVLNEMEQAIVVRTSWLYGPNGRSFPRAMLEAWLAGKELKGVVDEYGTPTYAPWLAEAVVPMMHSEIEGGTYHLAGSKTNSRYNFARLALEVYRRVHQIDRPVELEKISFLQWPSAAKRPQNASLDSSLLRSKLGLTEPSLGEQLQDFAGKVALTKPG